MNTVDFATFGIGTERRTLFRWTLGVRYQGLRDTTIALEYGQGTQQGPGGSDYPLLVPIFPRRSPRASNGASHGSDCAR